MNNRVVLTDAQTGCWHLGLNLVHKKSGTIQIGDAVTMSATNE